MFDILNKFGASDIHLKSDQKSGLEAIIAIHNTTLGPALGGCRFMEYQSQEEALIDAVRLAKGMTYKAALANLPAGGGKAVILKPGEPFDRQRLFRSFADFIETLKGRYVTALDCGTTLEDMDVIASRTRHVASSSKLGDCSRPTAIGIYSGIKAAFEQRFGQPDLTGIRIAIQGLGHVGMKLARLLHDAGGELIVSDLDPTRTAAARQLFKARVVPLDKIYSQPCEIFSPCGLGGIINDTSIDQLHCAIIAGAANNQLANDHQAQTLHRKNILYIPDFAINSGGLIYATMKYNKSSDAEITSRLAQIPKTITELIQLSESRGITPWQSAVTLAEHRLENARNTDSFSAKQASATDITMVN